MDIMTMNKRTAEGLCEIVHDISINLYCHLNNMDEDDRERLMDSLDGSRGVFWNHVLPWARNYQTMWEGLSDAERDALDYLIDIDAYTKAKFAELAAKHQAPDVASIQVVPVVEDADAGAVEVQIAPDAETSYWSVYMRDCSGFANWVGNGVDEGTAMLLGRALAAEHGVEVEPQPWKKQPAAPTERFHVSWHIDLDATDARAAALQALAVQRDPSSITTVFDVRDDGSDLAVRIDLGEST